MEYSDCMEKGSVVFGVGKCGYMEYSDCMEKGSVVFGVTNRVFMEYSNMVIYNHRCNIPCQVRIQIAMSCTIMMPLICDSSHYFVTGLSKSQSHDDPTLTKSCTQMQSLNENKQANSTTYNSYSLERRSMILPLRKLQSTLQRIAIGTNTDTDHDADFCQNDSMVAMAITENVATEATVVPPLPHGVANGGKRNVAARFHAMRDEIVRNPLF